MVNRFFIVLYVLAALWAVFAYWVDPPPWGILMYIAVAAPISIVFAIHFIIGFKR